LGEDKPGNTVRVRDTQGRILQDFTTLEFVGCDLSGQDCSGVAKEAFFFFFSASFRLGEYTPQL
jgi:hypothetical protein